MYGDSAAFIDDVFTLNNGIVYPCAAYSFLLACVACCVRPCLCAWCSPRVTAIACVRACMRACGACLNVSRPFVSLAGTTTGRATTFSARSSASPSTRSTTPRATTPRATTVHTSTARQPFTP